LFAPANAPLLAKQSLRIFQVQNQPDPVEGLELPMSADAPRLQRVPVRYLLPNLVTLIALCIGVTSIRLGIEGRFELAASAIILAIVLDAIDGRLARYLEGTSKFGAELDSLADFVNFGVAPAIILYFWSLNSVRGLGWVVCLMLAVACALRLARFNVMLDDPNKPGWMNNYFSGVPAPAGAGLALVPMYMSFLGIIDDPHASARLIAPLVFIVAILMISQVPTFSGKNLKRVPRDLVIPVLGGAALVLVCLTSFPWETLLTAAGAYAALIPLSMRSYFRLKKLDAAAKSADSNSA
jgi:CDP-diacylglycerol--serine O-phosphatidyltransferase